MLTCYYSSKWVNCTVFHKFKSLIGTFFQFEGLIAFWYIVGGLISFFPFFFLVFQSLASHSSIELWTIAHTELLDLINLSASLLIINN